MLAFPHTYRHRPEDMWYSMCLIRHPRPTAEIGFKINTNPILKVLLSLPHAGQIEHLCLELKEIQVLQKDGRLVDKRRVITLRILLSLTGQ